MSYKDQFNEWAAEFEEENGRDCTVQEAQQFYSSWLECQYDLADYYRKEKLMGISLNEKGEEDERND